MPQIGAGLGDRLAYVIEEITRRDRGPVVAMSSDSPTLPAGYLASAFDILARDEADVVLGPCDDGGYYLIGLSRPQPRLLAEVPMSTPHVLRDTLALAATMALRTALLPPWYDIDVADDLRRLAAELAGTPKAPTTRERFWKDFHVESGATSAKNSGGPSLRRAPFTRSNLLHAKIASAAPSQ